MPGNTCERCGEHLLFSQRKAGHRWCQLCAAELGVEQINDNARARVVARAYGVEPWWRWTVWLGRALQLTEGRIMRVKLSGIVSP